MKKIISTFAIAFSIVGCASKVEEKDVICKNGVCTLADRGASAANKNNTAVIEVTAENFDAVVKQATKPVVIDFYATWCRPCKIIKPIFAELAQEQADWVFVAVDVDQAPEIAALCGVSAMPTFVVFKNGEQWGSIQGGREKDLLMKELQSIAGNMTPVVAVVESAELKELITHISQGNVEEIKRLIQAGVDVNGAIKTPMGDMIPIQFAISSSREIIDALFEAGARIGNDFESSVKKQCAMYEEIVEALLKSFAYAQEAVQKYSSVQRDVTLTGTEVEQQLFAALNDITALQKLVDEGADVNAVLSFGIMKLTPLYLAIFSNNRELIDVLVAAGASLETEIIDQTGCKRTLELTIRDGLETMNQMLIKSYANLDYTLNHK